MSIENTYHNSVCKKKIIRAFKSFKKPSPDEILKKCTFEQHTTFRTHSPPSLAADGFGFNDAAISVIYCTYFFEQNSAKSEVSRIKGLPEI